MRVFLAAAAPMLATASVPIVVKTQFLAELARPDGQIVQVETNQIPYVVDRSCYRWVIHIKPGKGMRTFRERFTLPDSAINWNGVDGNPESKTNVSARRDAAETVIEANLSDGVISNAWCVAEGDPEGRYKIEVFDGKRLLHRFDFTVVGSGSNRT